MKKVTVPLFSASKTKAGLVIALSMMISSVSLGAEQGGKTAPKDDPEIHAAPESYVKMLHEKYPNTQFTSISGSEIPGLYEVVMGRNVAYADETGRYFVFGHIIDMEKRVDITAERMDRNNRIAWNTLPMQASFSVTKGKGTKEIAVFTDPDCPYCRRLESELEKLDDVTIHYFLMPLEGLHPASRQKSEAIWCSENQAAALKEAMQDKPISAPAQDKKCSAPVDEILQFARSNGINGTPTLIATDGRVLPGYAPAEQIKSWIDPANKSSGM